jgi:hypothetical protein
MVIPPWVITLRFPELTRDSGAVMKRRLSVTERANPETRSILRRSDDGTILLLGPDITEPVLCCGACGAILVEGVPARYIVDLVLDCNACAAHNHPPYPNLRHFHGVTVTAVLTFPHGTYALDQAVWWKRGIVLVSKRSVQGMEIAHRTEFPS